MLITLSTASVRMNLAETLEKARGILSEQELVKYTRILNRQRKPPVADLANSSDGCDNAIIKVELNKKEHELELLKRKKALDEKLVRFDRKRAQLTTERDAKFRQQQSNREKRILGIKTLRSAQGDDFEEKLKEKQIHALEKRNKLRQELVKRIQTHETARRDNFRVRLLDLNRHRDHRISVHDSFESERRFVGITPRRSLNGRLSAYQRPSRVEDADAVEARLSMLNDKLRAREDLVLRNKTEVRRALADKARKLEERSKKNLRSAQAEALEKQTNDSEKYRAKHVIKDRYSLRVETRAKQLGSFVERRTLYTTKFAQNRKRLRKTAQLVHELKMSSMLVRNKTSDNSRACVADATGATRRLESIKTKEGRRRIIRRIRAIESVEELQKLRDKLPGV